MSESFLYLSTIGRVTGKPHTIEIWYIEQDACYYLCAEHRKNSDWVKNIMKTPSVSFSIAQREQTREPHAGIVSLVTDENTIAELSQKFDAKYKWSKGLFVQICPVSESYKPEG